MRGSVIRRDAKDGRVTWSIKYRDSTGRQIKKAVGSDKAEAERALTAALMKVDRGELQSTSRETFREASERWLRRKQPILEASTHSNYERDLRLRLNPTFGSMRLDKITRQHVEDYLAKLDASGLSRKTANDSLVPLRQVLGRAMRDGVVSRNVAASDDRDEPLELPYERPPLRVLSREEALAYLDACAPDFRVLAELLLGTGIRVGEACALEWRDIDWDARVIRVERSLKLGGIGTTKGDRGRNVAVAGYLLDLLRRHRATQGRLAGAIFTRPDGEPLDRHGVYKRHTRAAKAAGLTDVRVHDLRHSYATLALAAGESMWFVSSQLGHADIAFTSRVYGHIDQAAHREAAERAAAWWRSASG